jgi:hypothetical protein
LIKLSKIDTISTKCGLLFGLLDQHLLIRLLNAHGHSDGSGGLAFYIHNIKIHQIYHYHRLIKKKLIWAFPRDTYIHIVELPT